MAPRALVRHSLPLYLLLCAVAALCITFSNIHLGQTSDSLVPVLVSLQHWTPFYWEQSRFGMLAPLLATPFEHPLINLLVQNALTIFAGLAALGLLTRFLVPSARWFFVACASCALFLACLAEPLRCDYLIAQPYGVSFSLGLGALLVVERKTTCGRYGLALGLLLLASWVNLAVGPALLLIVLARWFARRLAWRSAPLRLAALILVATMFGIICERCAPYRDARVTRLNSLNRTLESTQALVANTLHQGGPVYSRALAILFTAAMLAMLLAPRRQRRLAGIKLASFIGAALLLVLLAASGRWTTMNGCMPRYIYMALLTVQTGLIATIALTLGRAPGARQGISPTWTHGAARRAYAATLAVLAAVGYSYGLPSLAVVRTSLDARLGAQTGAVLRAGCTHIAGDYWQVWPAVFHANWKLHEQGAARLVWGVSYRSLPTEHLWAPRGGALPEVLLLGQSEHAEQLLRRHFSFALAAKDRTIPKL